MFDVSATVYALIGFMFVGSIIAIEARDLLSTVVSVSAVGAALSVIALIVGAPDIAITQVVVEVLCLVLLIRVVVTREDTTYDSHPSRAATAMGLVFVAFLVVICAVGFAGLRGFGDQGRTALVAELGARQIWMPTTLAGRAQGRSTGATEFRSLGVFGLALRTETHRRGQVPSDPVTML